MVAPANVRVNVQVPFPAMVTGSGPITIAKVNGVWQVGFSLTVFQQIFSVQARTQRSVTASPVGVQTTPPDGIINVNIATGNPTCLLPLANTRAGAPLTFKDVGGNFAAHPLVITAAGADTIDGLATITLDQARQAVTLVPFNDGVNTGWFII
jgi:hypothetical protein